MNDHNNKDITLQGFVNDINTIINTARTNAVRSVDFCRVQMYLAFSKNVAKTCCCLLQFLTLIDKSIINWELRMTVK